MPLERTLKGVYSLKPVVIRQSPLIRPFTQTMPERINVLMNTAPALVQPNISYKPMPLSSRIFTGRKDYLDQIGTTL